MKWDPQQYLQFERERSRAAIELLSRVNLTNPQSIVDLGCGPGNSTELLFNRYPNATIVGVDSSQEMLEVAQERLPKITFIEKNVVDWQPERPVDLMFANALFQWIPNHLEVLARLLRFLVPGGVIAVQIPDNLKEPNHILLRDLITDGPWSVKLAPIGMKKKTVFSSRVYYDALKPLAGDIEIWHSIYHHVLDGPAMIIEWMKGTGLQSYLQKLDEAEKLTFLANFELELSMGYPPLIDGKIMFTFPRIFMLIHACK